MIRKYKNIWEILFEANQYFIKSDLEKKKLKRQKLLLRSNENILQSHTL